MTNKVIEIEAKIERLQDRRKAIQSNGLEHLTAEYFNIENQLDSLYNELDDLAEVGE